MTRIIRLGTIALAVLIVVAAAPAKAQEQESKASAAAQRAQVPLKLQLVLSRYQGEKKISSVPYAVWVTTNEPATRLRMGLQIPVPVRGQAGVGTNEYLMKDVGTNIDCSAAPGTETGVYRLNLTVSDVSYVPAKMGDQNVSNFRNFNSTVSVLLRDGQTGQVTSATDPVNGEVLKIDATLNVLK